jgi:hypothetical protein
MFALLLLPSLVVLLFPLLVVAPTLLRPDNALLGDFGYSVPTWRQPKKRRQTAISKNSIATTVAGLRCTI